MTVKQRQTLAIQIFLIGSIIMSARVYIFS